MSLSFSTKAKTLSVLQPILKGAHIAPLVYFTVADWQSDQSECLKNVSAVLGTGPWIVRSSSQQEDSSSQSNAGAFLSV